MSKEYSLPHKEGNYIEPYVTNEILEFEEARYPDSRYSLYFLDKNNAKMIIMEHGSKSYIHDWQHDLNMYYKYKHGEFPPLNEGNELC